MVCELDNRVLIKNATLEELEEFCATHDVLKHVYNFCMTREVALDREFLEYMCKNLPNATFTIANTDAKTQELYDERETKILIENVNMMRQKYNKNLIFEGGYSVESGVEASRKLNGWVKSIKDARIKGRELSPFEKYLFAYQYATDFFYKDNKKSPDQSRNIIPVLTGDKIVCVGFARILKELCTRLDIPCAVQYVEIRHGDGTIGYHANNSVWINDPKYGICGIYYADSCWDCRKESTQETSILYSCMKYSDIERLYNSSIYVQTIDASLRDILFKKELKQISDNVNVVNKALEERALKILTGRHDFFVRIFDDIIVDQIDQTRCQTGTIRVPIGKEELKQINRFCEDMYSEIMIDDYSSDRMLEKTQKLIKYMMEDYGFTDDEVVQFLHRKAEQFKPNKRIARKFVIKDNESKQIAKQNMDNFTKESDNLRFNFRMTKEYASTISPNCIINALYNLGEAFGLNEKQQEKYVSDMINSSINVALDNSFEQKKGVDNPIVVLASSLK